MYIYCKKYVHKLQNICTYIAKYMYIYCKIYVHKLQIIQSKTTQLMVIIRISGIFYIITPSYMFRPSLFEPSSG